MIFPHSICIARSRGCTAGATVANDQLRLFVSQYEIRTYHGNRACYDGSTHGSSRSNLQLTGRARAPRARNRKDLRRGNMDTATKKSDVAATEVLISLSCPNRNLAHCTQRVWWPTPNALLRPSQIPKLRSVDKPQPPLSWTRPSFCVLHTPQRKPQPALPVSGAI